MTSERRGDWIQTFTGRKFYVLDPRPEDVDQEDIAHALSNICRFTGHCREFYSVAQHSVLVSEHCPNYPLHGLLHDAAEAYLGDLSRPLKRSLLLCSGWQGMDIEERILAAVHTRFGLTDSAEAREEVKRADNVLLVTEAEELMGDISEWEAWTAGICRLPEKVVPLRPRAARQLFVARLLTLR